MLTGILIIAIVALLGSLSHRRSRLENKIYKNVPLTEWLTLLIFPLFLYFGWVMEVKNILHRPYNSILPFDDVDLLSVTILCLIYGFVGNAMHFTSKILWRYLEKDRHSMSYKVNEMFHGRLSHYLTFLNTGFIIFLMSLLEINHPQNLPENSRILFLIILSGIIFGISASRTIFYTNEWFGGYHKPLFFVGSALVFVLSLIFKSFRLKFSLYPVGLFVVTFYMSIIITFLARQMFIFTRLGNKRKLRFVAKILSA